MLHELTVRSAKPKEKPYKLTDGGGLYVLVHPNGSRYWRFDYAFAGKRRTMAMGVYPEVSLKDARQARDDAKQALAAGLDPSEKKKQAAEATFAAVAAEWVERQKVGEVTREKHFWLLRIADDEFGEMPIADIKPAHILALLQRLERLGKLETAHRVRSICSRVFRHAVVTLRCEYDPTAMFDRAIMAPQVKHHAALTDRSKIGELMRAIRGYEGAGSVATALKVAPLVFVRPFELRHARWSEFDLDAGMWLIPAERMKMKREHYVPLSSQVVDLLREHKSGSDLVFPSVRSRDRAISENTVNTALRRLGYSGDEVCHHGFRRMASTVLHDNGFESDWIERQLAHIDPNRVRAAYNAAEYLDGRRKMMQWWADWLDAAEVEDLIG